MTHLVHRDNSARISIHITTLDPMFAYNTRTIVDPISFPGATVIQATFHDKVTTASFRLQKPRLRFSECLLHRTSFFAKLVKTCLGRHDSTSRKVFSSIISLRMLSGKHCTCHVPCVFVSGYSSTSGGMGNSNGLNSPFGQNSTP
jgi:hypothetical protein